MIYRNKFLIIQRSPPLRHSVTPLLKERLFVVRHILQGSIEGSLQHSRLRRLLWDVVVPSTIRCFGRPMVAPTTVFRHCSPFFLSTPQSTLSTAPLYGSLICLSLRRGARRAEWWFRAERRPRRHFSALPRATNGRPYDCIPPLLSVFPSHPSVDFVDSTPQVEPYRKPLLEERCLKGGVVALAK